MGLSMNTVKDLVANVADDAKDALDDILDRKEEPKGTGFTPGPIAGGGATNAVRGGAVAAGGLAGSAGALAELPAQINRLSEQIEALMKVLESMPQPPAPGASSRSKR